MDRKLYFTLKMLSLSGLLAAAVRENDGRFKLWIGDAASGVRATAVLMGQSDAVDWLVARALEHYPRSDFAKVRRLIDYSILAALSDVSVRKK